MIAIDRYRDALARAGELDAFAIDGLDHFGVPMWTSTLWGADGRAAHGAGYGATEPEALRGALGELVESHAAQERIRSLPRTHATPAELRRDMEPAAWLDPARACLEAGTAPVEEEPLVWVPATRVATGEPVLVPIELAATGPHDLEGIEPPRGDWLTTPITNGAGAGDTPERALSHGLLELLQRDGNSVAYRALDRRIGVELDRVEDPGLTALLRRIDDAGTELRVKLAAADFGMVNVYVVGWDRDLDATPHPLMVTACGEAVHPDRERAVRKAVLEFLSSRARKAYAFGGLELLEAIAPAGYLERVLAAPLEPGEPRALEAMLDWLGRDARELRALLADGFHAVRETVPLSSLPTARVDAPPALLARLLRAFGAEGLDVLWVDLSGDGVHAGHAIVPGLEVETATYHRIGARNVARLAAEGLAGLGAPKPGTLPVLGLDAWFDAAAIDRRVGTLYPLYREPDRHVTGRILAGELVQK